MEMNKKLIPIFTILSIALFACVRNRNLTQPNNADNILCERQGNSADITDDMNLPRYNYFNEFLLRGESIDSMNRDCIIRLHTKDSIIVECYSNGAKERYYYKHYPLFWFNRQEYDVDRENYYKDGRFPRVYNRFICKDIIYEFRHIMDVKRYDKGQLQQDTLNNTLFIKTPNGCTYINLGATRNMPKDLNKLYDMAKRISLHYKQDFVNLARCGDALHYGLEISYSHQKGYLEFTKSTRANHTEFQTITQSDTIMVQPTSCAYANQRAGFEGYCFAWKKRHDFEQQVYNQDEVDKLPYIKNGGIPLEEYINQQVAQFEESCDIRETLLIGLTINEKGIVQSAYISKSVPKLDGVALHICKNLPLLMPAVRRNKPVAIKLYVAIKPK